MYLTPESDALQLEQCAALQREISNKPTVLEIYPRYTVTLKKIKIKEEECLGRNDLARRTLPVTGI